MSGPFEGVALVHARVPREVRRHRGRRDVGEVDARLRQRLGSIKTKNFHGKLLFVIVIAGFGKKGNEIPPPLLTKVLLLFYNSFAGQSRDYLAKQ